MRWASKPTPTSQGGAGALQARRQRAVVPSAAHAEPVARTVEADQRHDDQRHVRGGQAGARIDIRFGNAVAVGPPVRRPVAGARSGASRRRPGRAGSRPGRAAGAVRCAGRFRHPSPNSRRRSPWPGRTGVRTGAWPGRPRRRCARRRAGRGGAHAVHVAGRLRSAAMAKDGESGMRGYGMRTGVAGGTAGAASVGPARRVPGAIGFVSKSSRSRAGATGPAGSRLMPLPREKYVLRHARCSRNDLEPGVQVGVG